MPDLRYERFPGGHYAVFTMDRPDRLNAQGAAMRQELRAALTEEQRIDGYHGNQPFGRTPKPFIAAVNGLAVGAGMERAADCDIRIASTEAYFGLFEVKQGILANYAINNLARVLPHGEAVYLMLSGIP